MLCLVYIDGKIGATSMSLPEALLVVLRAGTSEPVDAVIRRRLVTLGERGIVEDRIDEVIERAAEHHNGLADVQELAGAFADDVDAKQMARLAMEDDLE